MKLKHFLNRQLTFDASTKSIKMFSKRFTILVAFAFASAQCIKHNGFIIAPNIKLTLENFTNSEDFSAVYDVSPFNTNGSFPFNLQRYLRIFYFQTFHQTIPGRLTSHSISMDSLTENKTRIVGLERGSFRLYHTRGNFELNTTFIEVFNDIFPGCESELKALTVAFVLSNPSASSTIVNLSTPRQYFDTFEAVFKIFKTSEEATAWVESDEMIYERFLEDCKRRSPLYYFLIVCVVLAPVIVILVCELISLLDESN